MAKKTTTPTPPPFNPTPMATPMNPTDFWDEFMKAWYNWLDPRKSISVTNDAQKLLLFYINYGFFNNLLTPNDLPEPYLGNIGLKPNEDDDNVYKFVIININPGGCATQVDPKTIYYTKAKSPNDSKMKLGTTDGSLVQEFARTVISPIYGGPINYKYSSYLPLWSPLAGNKAKQTVTLPNKKKSYDEFINGYDWWNGNPNTLNGNAYGGRMKWINQFYGAFSGQINASAPYIPKNQYIRNSEVLALELCPFHSKGWHVPAKDWKNYLKTTILGECIKNYIFAPAFEAAKKANPQHPLIFGIGKPIIDTIETLYGGEIPLQKFTVLDSEKTNKNGTPLVLCEYYLYFINDVHVLIFKNSGNNGHNDTPIDKLWSNNSGIEQKIIEVIKTTPIVQKI